MQQRRAARLVEMESDQPEMRADPAQNDASPTSGLFTLDAQKIEAARKESGKPSIVAAPEMAAGRDVAGTQVAAGDQGSCTLMIEEMISQAWIESGGCTYPLETGSVCLGRHPECDLTLIDPTISSRHAMLECTSGRWYIRDLKSTNGTWIGGRKVIRRMRLKDGMHLLFGSREAVFHEC